MLHEGKSVVSGLLTSFIRAKLWDIYRCIQHYL
jgi:hypothetical protein